MNTISTPPSTRPGRSALLLLCGILPLLAACDPESHEDDAAALRASHDEQPYAEPEVEVDRAPEVASRAATDVIEESCGYAPGEEPVELDWGFAADGSVHVDVRSQLDLGEGGHAELSFYAAAVPSDGRPSQVYGDLVSLRAGEQRVDLPASLLAAIHSGATLVAHAQFEGCGSAFDNCVRWVTPTLHIESGRVFSAAQYREYLRAQYAAQDPQLFADTVVTAVIDMKGR